MGSKGVIPIGSIEKIDADGIHVRLSKRGWPTFPSLASVRGNLRLRPNPPVAPNDEWHPRE